MTSVPFKLRGSQTPDVLSLTSEAGQCLFSWLPWGVCKIQMVCWVGTLFKNWKEPHNVIFKRKFRHILFSLLLYNNSSLLIVLHVGVSRQYKKRRKKGKIYKHWMSRFNQQTEIRDFNKNGEHLISFKKLLVFITFSKTI